MWRPITATEPAEGEVALTCIDGGGSEQRNESKLKRRGRLWFTPDGSMYVYYTPTHYQPISAESQAAIAAAVTEAERASAALIKAIKEAK